ncbi:hypothetical protein [Frankia sp. AgB32]|uniref:hypothetical protein n=1 Tax=Frankia sp. AgB32 TaxID=631119 RepID=UPI00200BB26A|nr:hypothetical protein [Frankia sp. AgB32]MCK9894505.1 hypothetical protein [Frankia sp. AgB32]
MNVKPGRDPLGLTTITTDRLMPGRLPGILELSQRARYFSFHAFLLDEYHRRRLAPDRRRLSEFITKCEWDLGLAVLRCPRHCGLQRTTAPRSLSLPVTAAAAGTTPTRQHAGSTRWRGVR